MVNDKKKLRSQLLTQRRNLSLEDWQTKSKLICQHLINSDLLTNTVLIYSPINQEVNLTYLWENFHGRWSLSRCVENNLQWHLWAPNQPLHRGKYGLLEPDETLPMVDYNQVSTILIPSIACDRQGYRLGYGGGYYDRFLSDPHWSQKNTIGITFDFGYLELLPHDPWDIALKYVCTEVGLYGITN
jgi:5-formyltetrahydrofolate cyclo-ligase